MTFTRLLLDVRDRVATVTISRPEKRNALDAVTLDELEAAFTSLAGDDAVGGVILTGAGDKAFVAGADIGELAALAGGRGAAGEAAARRGQRVFDRIAGLGKPVVAAVNGFALGGGCELALACHVRVASEHARIGTPEVTLGIACGYGGTQRLPRIVGQGRALELLLTGAPIEAPEALRIGLFNKVVPADRLMAEAETLLRRMIANGPLALRATLEAVATGLDGTLAEGQNAEAVLFGRLCTSADMKEGTQAFLDRRPPRFSGR